MRVRLGSIRNGYQCLDVLGSMSVMLSEEDPRSHIPERQTSRIDLPSCIGAFCGWLKRTHREYISLHHGRSSPCFPAHRPDAPPTSILLTAPHGSSGGGSCSWTEFKCLSVKEFENTTSCVRAWVARVFGRSGFYGERMICLAVDK